MQNQRHDLVKTQQDDMAVRLLEEALKNSATKSIRLDVNNTPCELSCEGRWFKFSLLTKKRSIKRATIFETITELYNQALYGSQWRIAESYT